MPLHRVPETEINGTTGTIIGTAVYDFDTEAAFDADIGGIDGLTLASCEFVWIEIDGARIDRRVIEQIIGRRGVAALEEIEAEKIILMEREAA